MCHFTLEMIMNLQTTDLESLQIIPEVQLKVVLRDFLQSLES